MSTTCEIAGFRPTDVDPLVAASLACLRCLSADVEWVLRVDGEEPTVRCACRACGHRRTVEVTPEQSLRLALQGGRPFELTAGAAPWRERRGARAMSMTWGPGADALDLIAALLADFDIDTPGDEFYGRLCEALCQMTSMERAVLFLYDDARHRVRAVGSHRFDIAPFEDAHITLEDAPIAQRAFAEDRVVEVSEEIESELPPGYAELFGITTLTCTPLFAGGRRLGVILADRGGGRFSLSGSERYAMLMLGKTAALAASTRITTRQHEKARRLSERIDLAREVHERVIQRLFGVSLAIGSGQELSDEERERCAVEIQGALADLRTALQRPLAVSAPETGRRCARSSTAWSRTTPTWR